MRGKNQGRRRWRNAAKRNGCCCLLGATETRPGLCCVFGSVTLLCILSTAALGTALCVNGCPASCRCDWLGQ
jgi:hypothetical protein